MLSQGQEVDFKPDTQQTDVPLQAGGGQHTRAAMMTISDGYGGFNVMTEVEVDNNKFMLME